jgi:cytoskeleton protein RodZ
MERIGERLRRRREELGFTIEDISLSTRYRPETIKAVEEGRAGVFPAEAYSHAFLRAYAEKLKIDPAEILREQKSEEERIHDALRDIRLKPRRGSNKRRIIVLAVVVVGVAIALLLLYDKVLRPRVGRPASTEIGMPLAGGSGSPGMAAPDSTRGKAPADSLVPQDSLGVQGSEHESGSLVEMDEVSSAMPPVDEGSAVEAPEPPAVSPASAAAEPVGLGAGKAETGGLPAGPAATTSQAGSDSPGGVGGRDCLEVSVGHYAVKARLFAGDSLIINQWLEPGFRGVFCSDKAFWADTIIDQAEALLLVLNGEEVPLPEVRDKVITDFRISP